jgi:hypothetical protein
MFFQGDLVKYVGTRHKGLGVGEVCTPVHNEKDKYVVSFGDDAYVLPVSSITRHVPSASQSDDIDISVLRRRTFTSSED